MEKQAKNLCLHYHLKQLDLRFFQSHLAQGFWTWSQRLAISTRNSTEGRGVFEMHKAPGDIIEKLLLPKNVSEDFRLARHPPVL